ncbi:MAG TPA: hypothetical protein VHF90_02175 [Thermoleophilaceae bacterium]|nr:hypothetical protein [Thermoleophilaceae bacterium]
MASALVAAVLVYAAFAFGDLPEAHANVDYVCPGVWLSGGGGTCGRSYQSHWDRARNRYHGHQDHNVTGCVYMVNYDNRGALRGGIIPCGRTWSSPTWNPMGHNYGVTTQPSYAVWIKNGSAHGHTFTGWTSDNQTDG